MKIPKLLPALIASLGLLTPASHAALIVYDPFDYTASTTDPDPDGGVNGGNGIAYNSGGTVSSTGLRNNWYGTVTSSGLTYGSLPVSGNAITAGGSNNFNPFIYRNQDANLPSWPADPNTSLRVGGVSSGDFGADGTTLYFSWLMQPKQVGSGYRSLFQMTGDGGGTRIVFGLPYNSSTFQILNGSGGLANTGISATANMTYFMVARIDYAAGNDTVRFWINPSLGGSETSADATMTSYDVGVLNGFSFRFDSTTPFVFDEFRIGTSWADVTPIPEPGSFALFAAGLGAVAFIRRRRRHQG